MVVCALFVVISSVPTYIFNLAFLFSENMMHENCTCILSIPSSPLCSSSRAPLHFSHTFGENVKSLHPSQYLTESTLL